MSADLIKFNEAPSGDDVNRTDGTNLEREKKAIQDDNDLKCIQVLRKSKEFRQYYLRRLGEEKELLVKELQSDTTVDRVHALRFGIRLIDKMIAMPDSDRQIKWRNLHPGKLFEPED